VNALLVAVGQRHLNRCHFPCEEIDPPARFAGCTQAIADRIKVDPEHTRMKTGRCRRVRGTRQTQIRQDVCVYD